MPEIERAVIPALYHTSNRAPHAAGWVCPRCQNVWSPYVRRCIHCGMPPRSQTGQAERRGSQ